MRSCYQCKDRRAGCHSQCERYAHDRAEDEKRRAYERSLAYVGSMPQTVSAWRKTMATKRTKGSQ